MLPSSGLLDDATVNTFHVTKTGTEPVWIDVLLAWQTYMDALRNFFSAMTAETGHTLKVYDLADPEPRAPIFTGSWEFSSAPTGDPLPAEVALCISFEGARISGEPQRRRRGRMYMGPIAQSINDNGRPGATALTNFVGFFQDFVADLNLSGGLFAVWSRMDGAAVEVVNSWVDNAWDTQRRRGLAPTHRDFAVIEQGAG